MYSKIKAVVLFHGKLFENSQVINVLTGHLLSVYLFYLESDGLAISGETFDVPNQQTHLVIGFWM